MVGRAVLVYTFSEIHICVGVGYEYVWKFSICICIIRHQRGKEGKDPQPFNFDNIQT